MKQPVSARSLMLIILLVLAGYTGQPLVRAQDKRIVSWHFPTYPRDEYQEIAEGFNASQDEIELFPISFNATTTPEYLQQQTLLHGNVVMTNIDLNYGAAWEWLDLEPLITKAGYDLSRFDPRFLDLYRQDGKLVGLPLTVYPSVMFYNRALFDAAGIAYPPHGVGEPYADGDVWDMAKLRAIALQLTLDAEGHNAADPLFNPETIVQFGFASQWPPSLEAALAPFGTGRLMDDTEQALMPAHWRAGLEWYYEGLWSSHFIMPYGFAGWQQEDITPIDNPIGSGHVAMVISGLWLRCCIDEVMPLDWDIAMLPGSQGQVTGYLYDNSIRILTGGSDPDAAFKALTYLVDQIGLGAWAYAEGGIPAQVARYSQYKISPEALSSKNVDWQVAIDSLPYAQQGYDMRFQVIYTGLIHTPAQEYGLEFLHKLQSTPGLNLDAEIEAFLEGIQMVFDTSQSTSEGGK